MEQHHRWSSLPDDIVFKIISHLNLPIEFVITISTSIFSIKELHRSNRIAKIVYEPHCWTIFDNLFILFTTPAIDTFYLNLRASFYEQPLCCPIIDTWVRRLRSCNIRHFTINLYGNFRFEDREVLPPSIFQMHSLVSLKLHFYLEETTWSDQLPMILLPNLKELYLVSSSYGPLEELITGCPSLEDLSLTLNSRMRLQKSLLSITSKKLKRLYINLQYDESSILNVILDAPILEHFRYVSGSVLSMQMLDTILNVKSLALCADDWGVKFYNCPKKTVFPNLSHLTLSFRCKVHQKLFDEQLVCCPNLKVLKLHFNHDHRGMILNEDAKFALVERVKRLEVYMAYCGFSKQQLLNLLTWLLKSAKVLEKLVLSSHDFFYYDNLAKSQIYQTLFECVESTSRCQIEFVGVL